MSQAFSFIYTNNFVVSKGTIGQNRPRSGSDENLAQSPSICWTGGTAYVAHMWAGTKLFFHHSHPAILLVLASLPVYKG